MKKLLIALAAAATAIGSYATTAINGAGFDSGDNTPPYSWNATDGFDATVWSGASNEVATIEAGNADLTDDVRPEGYQITKTGYLKLKTTLGQPVLQAATAVNSTTLLTDDGFFYDGLVQFTAFDETPDMAAYTDAKIGIFPMLENPDSETAYLWVYANGNPTNLWKTTKVIDGDWHRVTIKMIKNVTRTASVNAGFVVFVDGEAVDCMAAQAAFEGLDLNPAAQAYFNNGQLFRSLAPEANEFTGVAYDGQGLLDEVGFTDLAGAPEFALDENWATVTWTSDKIAKVYITDGESVVAESTTGFVDFVRAADKTYSYYYDAIPGYIGISAEDAVEITAATTAITDEPTAAAFEIGSTPYATWADAVEAASGDVTITVKGAYTMDADDLEASINNATGLTTIDFAGNVLTGCVIAGTAIKFVDSSEGTAGGIAGVAVYAAQEDETLYAVLADSSAVSIENGQFDGYVSVGDGSEIAGGAFKELFGLTAEFYLADYIADGYAATYAEGYWTIQESSGFTVTVAAANTGSKIASIVVDGQAVAEPAAGEFLAETSVVVTYAADYGYKFTDPTQAEQTLTAAGSTTAPEVVALPIVAYIGTVPYYSLGDAVAAANDNDEIDIANDYAVDSNSNEVIVVSKKIAIDLNGHTLTVPVTSGKNVNRFGTAANGELTLKDTAETKGKIVTTDFNGYGITVAADSVINVSCRIEQTSKSNPVFDIYGGTVNCGADADIFCVADIFRFKDNDLTSTVNVTGGKYESEDTSDTSRCIFHHYKAGHTANIAITGGEFTFKNHLIDAYAEEGKDAPVLNFAAFDENSTVRFQYKGTKDPWVISSGAVAEGKILAAGCEIVADTEKGAGWYKVAKAAAYPTYLEEASDEAKARYDVWKQTYGADTESAYEDAFLLNCDPAAVDTEKANFKIISIEKVGDAWVVKVTGEKGQSQQYGNGFVNIISVKETFGADGVTADFFKAELTIDPVVK